MRPQLDVGVLTYLFPIARNQQEREKREHDKRFHDSSSALVNRVDFLFVEDEKPASADFNVFLFLRVDSGRILGYVEKAIYFI
jgi:hypothetical protein